MPPPEDPTPDHVAWIELPDQRTILLTGDCRIGRIEGNEIINPDTRISRRHSVVQHQGDRFVLVDLGSTNGTFLNEVRIFKPTRLKDGDVIMIGAERYTFCYPQEAADPGFTPGDSAAGRTTVMVGKVSCWMLLVSAPLKGGLPVAPWMEKMRQMLAAADAGIRQGPGDSLLAHWRDRVMVRDKVRALTLELAAQAHPARGHLALHYGAVRVGSAAAGEENLLGAEVTFTYQLAAAAAGLGEGLLLSESAVQSLDLGAQARPLGARELRDIPGSYALFALGG